MGWGLSRRLLRVAVILFGAAALCAQPESAMQMKPFRVFAEMVDLQPIIDNKNDSKIVGLLVARVSPKSMAERAGLRRGMVITSLQGMRVEGLSEGELAQRTAKLPPTPFHTLLVTARQSYGSRGEREYEIILPRAPGDSPRPTPRTEQANGVPREAVTVAPRPVAIWQVDLLSAGVTTLEDEASISEIVVTFQRPKPTSRANLEIPRAFTVNVWDDTSRGGVVKSMKIEPAPRTEASVSSFHSHPGERTFPAVRCCAFALRPRATSTLPSLASGAGSERLPR